MKIVTRDELLTHPPGTLFAWAKGPGEYSDLCILGEPFGPDFTVRDLGLQFYDTADLFEREEAMWAGASVPVNEAYGREGMFDSERRYLVYERADVESIVAAIMGPMS